MNVSTGMALTDVPPPSLVDRKGWKGGRVHSLDEWIDVEKTSSVEAIRVLLAIILGAAGGR